MIRTVNNGIRSLLFQAQLPPTFWVEAMHTVVHILNILPSKAIQNKTPYTKLFSKTPSYTHLRTFGCLCYPNINHSHTPKLSPRSSACIFLGYPLNHKGYRCFDLTTKKIIISRHVNFDETCFPYPSSKTVKSPTYDFLDKDTGPSPLFRAILQNQSSTTTPTLAVIPTVSPQPTQVVPPTNEAPRHTMTTRSKHGIKKPKQILSLLSETKSPLPKSYLDALKDPNWNPSMNDEYDAIIKSDTFDLVPRPPNTNIVRSMWLHKHKYNADGTFKKHKSRLVANGKSQEEGIDFTETYSRQACHDPSGATSRTS